MNDPVHASNPWGRGCLVMVGISHRATSLEVRERLALSANHWRELTHDGPPSVLLSTCNRVEVYAWSETGELSAAQLRQALALAAHMPPAQLEPHPVTRSGEAAIVHLVRVAAGLDSLVVGEDQIRGQVRAALNAAIAGVQLPAPLAGIFERVLKAARSIRFESPLGQHPSIAVAGVDLALRGPELKDRPPHELPMLVLGAGSMARSALAYLVGLGAPVTLLNRTVAHAVHLAADYGPTVAAASLDRLPEVLPWFDLVVCGTASRRPILDRVTLEAAHQMHSTRPLVMVDIAVPRDVEPSVRSLPGVRLIDLDDLGRVCPVDAYTRAAQVERLETQAREEARAICGWLNVRASAPEITRLRARAHLIRSAELQRVGPRLKHLTPVEMRVVEELSNRVVNKLLHAPTVALRERAYGRAESRALAP
jgi:glutamyl-tRNA reductase